MRNRIIGPFFFHQASITADVYLDLLTKYVTPQLIDFQPTITFQQDGAPPHWGLHVREFLNETFPDRWIGGIGAEFVILPGMRKLYDVKIKTLPFDCL